MIATNYDLVESLEQYFGFTSFKGKQQQIIESVLEGRDTFVIMPTGGGKSLCYQLPAMMMQGTAIVISPLIALMKNQVDSIRGYSDDDSVAHFLNSSLNKGDVKRVKEDILAGKTKLLFVAPETLTKEENLEFFKQVDISFIAVDEAHCISEWGHDFRPEYRRIRQMINSIDQQIPIVALTATATPKVQSDILKNLEMQNVNQFIDSFNRHNLYYDIRPKRGKEQTIKEIVQIVKSMEGKSGIVYVQSRKSTEEIAQTLQVNGIKAAPYHAGLDARTRSKVQDQFLMEDIDVICATIAFGMGIDKPDVRFVIHFDIPKSIENYYQETGRGGRDGLEGKCFAFYSPKDILKLEKFLRDKPVAERELGGQLLEEVVAYSETSACRRKFLLHYFGEEFDDQNCDNMCDNCKHPKEKVEVQNDMVAVLKTVALLKENYGIKVISDFMNGTMSKEIRQFEYNKLEGFGTGKDQGEIYWHSIIRQAILNGFLYKEIEQYGLLKMTDAGHDFIANPYSIQIPINHDYSDAALEVDNTPAKTIALDAVLVKMLQDLRRQVAKQKSVPPWVIFQDPSLNDMATQYPGTMEALANMTGVSMGKAQKYGRQFLDLINDYVEENDIERPTELVIKQMANKSKSKVAIIQGVDRKLPLEDLAGSLGVSMDGLLDEMDMIVSSGTKLSINYYLEENIDDVVLEDIHDYLMEADSDSIEEAFEELKEDDITLEEIRLVRIQFLSEIAN